MDKRQQTCCFTGHRILPRGMEDELWTKTYAHLQPLLTQGVRYFGVGGALGFDTLIAERLLELRDIISPIKVILVLPFRSYQSRWTPEQQIRAAKIEARADKIVYCSDAPSRNAFLYRDRHLVNGSAYCIGYCTRTISGSAYTLRYAREQGLTVWNIGEEQQDNLVEEARELFIGTIHSLRVEYPNVTVRLLDHDIWDYMAHRK